MSLFCCIFICPKTAGWVANGVDSDQMPHFVAPDQGLQCLLRLILLNTYLGLNQYPLRKVTAQPVHSQIRTFAFRRQSENAGIYCPEMKSLIRLYGCAGWSGPALFTYALRPIKKKSVFRVTLPYQQSFACFLQKKKKSITGIKYLC